MKDLITILTPTYNREHTLHALFESLRNQTNHNFKWLVIDDGSTDNTESFITTLQASASDFEILYLKKENGGKHTALNLGFQMVTSYLTFIVDSDDVLTPDAVEKVISCAEIVREQNLAGVAFLCGYSPSQPIGDAFPKSHAVMNDIDVRCRHHVSGDKAEVWRTDILKQYQFPVFPGEKFQGENYVWWQIAKKYQMFYINEIIYIAEYLEDGLTKSGRKLRILCPFGGMENSKIGMTKEFPLLLRIKCSMLYDTYAMFAKLPAGQILKKSNNRILSFLCLFPSFLLYLYWKNKYLD